MLILKRSECPEQRATEVKLKIEILCHFCGATGYHYIKVNQGYFTLKRQAVVATGDTTDFFPDHYWVEEVRWSEIGYVRKLGDLAQERQTYMYAAPPGGPPADVSSFDYIIACLYFQATPVGTNWGVLKKM